LRACVCLLLCVLVCLRASVPLPGQTMMNVCRLNSVASLLFCMMSTGTMQSMYGCTVDRWMASPPHRHHLPNFFARGLQEPQPLSPSRLTRSFRPIAELFAGVRPCTFMCQLPCLNDDHSAKRWIGFSPPETPPPPSFKSPTNWFHNLRIINATYWHYDGASPTRWHYL
jgi:hypothetical protein